jgi:hypothetical protein
LIAYSLGNFIFDMMWEKACTEAVILEVTFTRHGDLTHDILPVRISKNCQPTPLREQDGRQLLTRFHRLCSKIDIGTPTGQDSEDASYQKEFKPLLRRQRLKSYRYFLSHLGSYKKKYLWQQMLLTLRSRLEDIENTLASFPILSRLFGSPGPGVFESSAEPKPEP